jgi:hypothetical protein
MILNFFIFSQKNGETNSNPELKNIGKGNHEHQIKP